MTIVCLGEILIDRVVSASGESNDFPGGAPANVAIALARLGATVAFTGAVGSDRHGQSLLTLLNQEGVNCIGVQTMPHPTRIVEVRCTAEGDRAFGGFIGGSTAAFADTRLSAQQLPLALLKSASVLITGTLGMAYQETREAMQQAASVVKAQGGRLIIDVNWRPTFWTEPETALDILLPWLHQADWLKISADEAIALFQTDSIDVLSRKFPAATVLITDGAQGCRHAMAGSGQVPAFQVNSVETTGAGDAFLAGMVYQLLQQNWQVSATTDFESALIFANAMGALTTLKPGAIAALPTPQELIAFLQKYTGKDWRV
ncbi:carbohydrate kinase [Oscillatoria sp. CS-180]|uniref:carbohydrate kinase family protein n=1 Tax=Oscillatoria sp. CS-180 TaxID=3021720 RepID=UPI00233106C4|nr:carbohydrate kinase [Oscillatoria sp. CS-180]MDB9528053.1 carbohydrate kinase [Oscillatoria sp. CS-180]